MVKSYIEDGDPDSALSVGADMRKINYCFQLLKVKSPCLQLSTLTLMAGELCFCYFQGGDCTCVQRVVPWISFSSENFVLQYKIT